MGKVANIFLAIMFLMACASIEKKIKERPYISINAATDSVKITGSKDIHNGTYYTVPVSELIRIDSTSNLTYLGTENGIHLMRIWEKVLASKDEICLFSIKKDSCEIDGARSPKEEFAIYSAGYRPVDFIPGCLVKEYFPESELMKRKIKNENIKK